MTQMYESPQMLSLSDASEGVYLASGLTGRPGASWNISVKDSQTWNGTDHVFEAECTLNSGETINVDGMTIVMEFNYPLTSVRVDQSNYACSFSGNTVTLVMNDSFSGGPGYKAYAQIYASTGDEATTKGLRCSGSSCV